MSEIPFWYRSLWLLRTCGSLTQNYKLVFVQQMLFKKPTKATKATKATRLKHRALVAALPDYIDCGAVDATDALVTSTPENCDAVMPSQSLPIAARTLLDALSEVHDVHPKRLATLSVDEVDTIVESHAKVMAATSKHCAELLRTKYVLLDSKQLRDDFAARDYPTLVQFLACVRKSARHVWLQPKSPPLPQQHFSLSHIFEVALSARHTWPNPLDLDLVNAACSRELQLPYKDERERVNIMELHGKAQVPSPSSASPQLQRVPP